jgi:phosphoglycolate phosphatase-like HAD superfamily hydrolase
MEMTGMTGRRFVGSLQRQSNDQLRQIRILKPWKWATFMSTPESTQFLRSWNDSTAKSAILNFVVRVTEQDGPDFVEPPARIAVFDNDGTLWCEKPMPIQTGFLLGKIGEQAKVDSSLRDKQPWKAVFEHDHEWLAGVITKHYNGDDSDLKLMAAGLLSAYAGETVESYAEQADKFLRSSQNAALKRPYLKTAYAPMRELLDYLAANGFTNYIVSGGGRDFMRPVTQELYGIPPERVVGSSVALEYKLVNGVAGVYHTPKLEIFDDGPAKVVRLWSRIGAKPIFAACNSNGDIEMITFATSGKTQGLGVLVNHDDDARDIAYTAGAEKVIAAANERGWVIASVKSDWSNVFVD